MSTFPNPPDDSAEPVRDPNPAPAAIPPRSASSRGAEADFEFMLILRAAARSLGLRNRVVLARRPRARKGPLAAPDADPPLDPAHPA